jgi:galactonate dehydratase
VRGGPQRLDDGAIRIDDSPGFGAPPVRAVIERSSAQGIARPASLAGMAGAGGDA